MKRPPPAPKSRIKDVPEGPPLAMPLHLSVALFLAGLAAAAVGGDLFLRGVIELARALRVPPGVVGVTVAAFATSSPELAVAVTAAARGQPELSVGDSIGSNVVNAGLVLGLALLRAPLRVEGPSLARDRAAALAAPALTAALLADGALSRADAALLLAAFGAWLLTTVRGALRARDEEPVDEAAQPLRTGIALVGGLAALVGAGHLTVAGARGIGGALGLSAFTTGATLVAFGTSVPELATTLIAARRGHDDVSVGTLLGSNLFNGLFVVGVAGAIRPARPALAEVAAGLAFGLLTTLLMTPGPGGVLARGRGAALLLCYGAYVTLVLRAGGR